MARAVGKSIAPARKVPAQRVAQPKKPPDPAPDDLFIDALIPTQIEEVEVTPDLAAYWLTLNTHNRKIKEGNLNKMVADLKEGNWLYTAEPIKFSKTGVLLDGQHRLAAIVKTGVTVTLLVVPNLEDDSQDAMDTGSSRGARDVLTLHGEQDGSLLASATRLAIILEAAPDYSRRDSISNAQILKWVSAHPEMRGAVAQTGNYRRLLMGKSVIAYCVWRLNQIDPEGCHEFFKDLAEHRTTGLGDPRHTLIDRLISAKKANTRLNQLILVSMVFRTWNAVRAGKRLTVLKVTYNGDAVDIPIPK